MYRVRTDVILICGDEDVVDPNRIRLPADTPIIDRRKLPGDPEAEVQNEER